MAPGKGRHDSENDPHGAADWGRWLCKYSRAHNGPGSLKGKAGNAVYEQKLICIMSLEYTVYLYCASESNDNITIGFVTKAAVSQGRLLQSPREQVIKNLSRRPQAAPIS